MVQLEFELHLLCTDYLDYTIGDIMVFMEETLVSKKYSFDKIIFKKL